MKTKSFLRVAACLAALSALISTVCGDDRFSGDLGVIRFEVSGNPEARDRVVRGVKLLHHMMYPEADREFAAAATADPDCALAHWGRAMVIIHPLWPDVVSDAERIVGAGHIRRGLASSVVTPRERAYLETLGVFFGDGSPADYVSGLKALDVAWTELATRFPDDLDAACFSALYHLAPARFVAKDKSHRLQLEAAAQIQRVLQEIPDHPGAQHYKIHALDFPLLADRALEVCDTYSSIAPDVPHALHMPTHIYTRRGLWAKSIEFNLRSAEAARKLAMNDGALNGHYPHALDYLAYAYLQRGQYGRAMEIRDRLASMHGPYSTVQPTAMAFAFAAVPARCALERKAWAEAAAIPLNHPADFPWGKAYLNCESIIRFARAVGAARGGSLDAARAEIVELERISKELSSVRRESYWASQAETQLLAARAWVAFESGDTNGAIATMSRAADLEAGVDKEAVTPGEVLPAGDQLGDMLLEAGRPADALAAFERVLAMSPNRLNTLRGAGLAAERSGDASKARLYSGLAAEVAVDADPEVALMTSRPATLAAR